MSLPNLGMNRWFGASNSAIAQFTKAAELEPDNEQAYLLLVNAYTLTGDLAAVQKVWKTAERNNSDVKWVYKRQAQFHQSFRQNDDVIETWQRAVVANPHASWGYIELFKAHKQARNWPAAEATWQSAIEANQDEVWPYQQLANYHKSRKKWALVEQTYWRAIRRMPNEPSLYQLLGNHLFGRKKWTDAIEIYRTSIALSPDLASSHLNLGRSLLRMNEINDGIESLEQAILLEPIAANYKILRQELEQFPPEKQISSYQKILASAPDAAIARYRLVNLYQFSENCDSAIDTARAGIDIHQDETFYHLLATTLQNCENLTGAMEVYMSAVEKFPYSSAFPLTLGKLQLEQNDLRAAISSFASGLQLQETPKNYRQVNQWFTASLPVEEAIVAMQATIASAEPAINQPYQDLIQTYRLLGQPEEAISVMMLATQSNPESAWGYSELAKLYIEDERTEKAEAAYAKAIDVEPDNASIHYALAQLLYQKGDLAAAIISYQNAYDISPENRGIQARFGRALLASGQLEHGVRMMELAYQAKPDNNTYRFMRVAYQDILGWPTSQPYQERAARLRWPDPSVAFLSLANIYANTEQPKAARYNYQKALAADSENTNILSQLANFSLAQADCKGANEYGIQAVGIAPSSATYLQLANVYATCGPPEATQITQQRSVENYLLEQAPQSNKRNVVDRTIRRYRDILPEEQIITYLATALETVELDRIEPYMQLGWYYETEVDPPNPPQALVHYQQAVKAHPRSFNAVSAVGRLLHDGGAPAEALSYYRKAILLRQNDQGMRVRYGRALIETGEVEQGQAVLASALKLEPVDWYTSYAIEGYLTSLPAAEAVGYVTETLTLVPSKSEEVYMPPVRYYLGLGDTGTAIDILDLAIDSNPKLDWPHVKLSYLYRELDEYDLAVEQMQLAIQKRPRVAWNHADLGALYRENGDLDAALLSLAQVVVLDPKNAWNHIYYGQALLESGQADAGRDELYLALEAEQTEDVYAFADGLFKKHLTANDARNVYTLLLEADPNNELAQQYLDLWLLE